MSEVTELKKKIIARLGTISDSKKLKRIEKLINKLEEPNKGQSRYEHEEETMARNEDVNYLRQEIDVESLSTEIGPDGESLQSLVIKAFSFLAK